MADNFLSDGDVDTAISATARETLLTDDGDTGTEWQTRDTRLRELSTNIVRMSLENAGYEVASGDTSGTAGDSVKNAALAVYLYRLYARKGYAVPESFAVYMSSLPEGIRTGELPISGQTPSADDGVGGARFSDTSESTGNPRIMDGLYKL